MEIVVPSVPVDDQQTALEFYTDVLGFETATDTPVGGSRWLTVVGPNAPDGVELLLEPTANPAVADELAADRDALVTNGIPWTSFGCDDGDAVYERLRELDVEFTQQPMMVGGIRWPSSTTPAGPSSRSPSADRTQTPARSRPRARNDAARGSTERPGEWLSPRPARSLAMTGRAISRNRRPQQDRAAGLPPMPRLHACVGPIGVFEGRCRRGSG